MPSIAVIDLETTGLNPYRHDRIVEMAALLVDHNGTFLREFETLVNPERDVGPTHVHGLTAGDVLNAPRFAQIAGELVENLEGCVAVAGHNARFDQSFLEAEFARVGYTFPECRLLCTMQLAGGGGLFQACSDHGIPTGTEAHMARSDARVTAQLLLHLLRDAPRLAAEVYSWPTISWPSIQRHPVRALTREASRRCAPDPPTYLQVLLSRVQLDIPAYDDSSAILEYTALLDRVIEDRRIDEQEGQSLWELAERWAISGERIRKANQDYLLRLATAAWADGVITAPERRDLERVASLLGIGARQFADIVEAAALKSADARADLSRAVVRWDPGECAGKQVCFTGDSQCRLNGEVITRDIAAQLAVSCGMVVKESVTKRLDILVVADPDTQSGKAKRARQHGIRIVQERVFWRSLGLEVE